MEKRSEKKLMPQSKHKYKLKRNWGKEIEENTRRRRKQVKAREIEKLGECREKKSRRKREEIKKKARRKREESDKKVRR